MSTKAEQQKMNLEKLKKLKDSVRTGGKGTQRRKLKKKPHQTGDNDKKISQTIKRLGAQQLDAIEEVNMFKKDGKVIHITKPKVQAAINANTFLISGNAEEKQINQLLPDIISQMGSQGFQHYQSQLGGLSGLGLGNTAGGDDDEVPDLVDNVDKTETKTQENKEVVSDDPPPLEDN